MPSAPTNGYIPRPEFDSAQRAFDIRLGTLERRVETEAITLRESLQQHFGEDARAFDSMRQDIGKVEGKVDNLTETTMANAHSLTRIEATLEANERSRKTRIAEAEKALRAQTHTTEKRRTRNLAILGLIVVLGAPVIGEVLLIIGHGLGLN